ncbi:hypothetical protein TUM20985_25860 [Mycobacterium antarcticum]|uniref:putative quinol monooxygenase n=1 Tax=unclassified Mycolicibacterium TaxID=2636767 RepID=UPI002398CB15|nr:MULTISPECIES: antibiotic biosynthesis monooxygenase family protein [unclassified Mycolicibacterium]BDX32039.1 hypothetical protein TUM20985_25860 [Mycolicibacterium sp. TUM20985]GLP75343.1 hypothetical protein TUM20983_24530 [Mycolicibacterium sp. TUM20983]GLP84393.1 hypothetical protein TUM20984_58130 [Mycolicibacterium sp. TUM20984]
MGSNDADGVIVAGHLTVAPGDRNAYLAGCVDVVRQARAAPGCLDFAVSPDLLDPSRINVYRHPPTDVNDGRRPTSGGWRAGRPANGRRFTDWLSTSGVG